MKKGLVGGSIPSLPTNFINTMKAYHVHSVNSRSTLNYITCSRERAVKDQCVFVQVNEIEIEDIPYNAELHNKMLTDVQRLFDPMFNIQPKKENLVEIMTTFRDAFLSIEGLKK